MADKRISQLIERVNIANNDVLPIVASGATTTNKVTISTIQTWMQDNLDVGVTSVGITIGSTGTDINVTGSPITTSGNITINIPTASATNRGLLSSSDWSSFNSKLSSVGLTMPSAFTVSNSPLTANGTIAVTGAGTVAQYIRGDGSLADFPEAGGGGASVSYYLNGSVSQGTIGGIAYYEMNKTPVLGAGTDFVAIADGYLASFITDAGDPSLLLIPGGNWNFETYFSASSGGGSPSFYIELYKVDSGGTATLIASNSAVPELIAFGTTITPYFSTLAVPTTVLTLTDRLALRYYVARSGRTITLHTENSHLCQIITTFTTGLTALNGLTAQVQNFATGTSGTDFNISSTSATHTFNLPDASASNRGAVTTGTQTFAGVKTFNSTITAGAEVQLVQAGTALPTFIKNISGNGLTSSGSNGIGFNNSNNLYLSGSDKGGAVFSINNTGVRTYTFQDNNGTLAFTSDIPTNPVGGTGTTNVLPKFTASSTIGDSAVSDNTNEVSISKRLAISTSTSSFLLTPHLGGTTNRIETLGSLPLALVTAGSSITLAAGGTTPQFTLASSGAATFTSSVTAANHFSTGGSTFATSSGQVGIGTSSYAGDELLMVSMNGTTNTQAINVKDRNAAATSSTYMVFRKSDDTFQGNIRRAGTDNALYVGGNEYISFGTGGNTERMRITSSGNVGIGTTSPATYSGWGGLDVRGTNGGHIIVANTGGTNRGEIFTDSNGFNVSAQTNNALLLKTNDSTRLTLSSTGAANFSSSVTATQGTFTRANDGGVILRIGNVGVPSDTYFDFVRSSTTGALSIQGNQTGNNNIILAPTSGNVGIGTASPNRLAEIVSSSGGVLGVSTSASGSSILYGRIGMYSTAASNSYIDYGGEIRSYSGAGIDYSDLRFYTAGGSTSTERMRITSGGFLKASNNGTYLDSGASYHEIRNTSGGSNALVLQHNSANTPYGLNIYYPSASPNSTNFEFIYANDSTQSKFIVWSNGSVVNRTGSYGTISDIKFKENVEDASPKLDDILKLKVRNFNLIGDDKKQIGFIAQEFEEVFPSMVDSSLDKETEEEYKSIKTSVLIPMLVKAIQEQQEQIKSLTEQVEALKSQING